MSLHNDSEIQPPSFSPSGAPPPEEKKREKFLTAKYGAHQMALIRKRLRVEMWMYERLHELYGAVRLTSVARFRECPFLTWDKYW